MNDKQSLCEMLNGGSNINEANDIVTLENSFIDQYEVEDMLGDYYDFSTTTVTQWIELDGMIKLMCQERGILPVYEEEYARICDVCCEKLGIAKAG